MLAPGGSPFSPPARNLSDIERDEIVRKTLKEIEYRLNATSANKTYQMAFKVVLRIMRNMEP